MAIVSVDDYVASQKQIIPFLKTGLATVAGQWQSLWTGAGYPAAGSAPGAAAVPTDATTGAPLVINPTGGANMYAGRWDAFSNVMGQLILYDRLSHYSGLSGTTFPTAQTVNTATINRGDTSGVNVEGFLEWYAATGGTGTTATVVYTDDTSTSRSATMTLAATRPAGLVIPIPLIGAAAGIKSVQTVALAASTGGAGTWGVTLARRIATIPITIANAPQALDPFSIGLPEVFADACLWMVWIPNTTTVPVIAGSITLASG